MSGAMHTIVRACDSATTVVHAIGDLLNVRALMGENAQAGPEFVVAGRA